MEKVLVGTYTTKLRHVDGHAKGAYSFNLDNGDLTKPEVKPIGENPTYIGVKKQADIAVVCNECDPGEVSLVKLNDDGTLGNVIDRIDCEAAPCHVDVHEDVAFIANYGGGSIDAIQFSSTKFEKKLWHVKLEGGAAPGSDRQNEPHTHFVKVFTRHELLLVIDLGCNSLFVYQIKQNCGGEYLTTPKQVLAHKLHAGAGPRHAAFHPIRPYFYVINELDNTVCSFQYRVLDEHPFIELKDLGHQSTLQGQEVSKSAGAAIRILNNGKFLYCSNRWHDSLAIFKIDEESGLLTFVECQSVFGKTPRDFIVHSTDQWVIVANQDSDNIVVFACNPENGLLTKLSEVSADSPVSLLLCD